MTNAGFSRTELTTAAERAALVLARELGLGDGVRAGSGTWAVDAGDMTLCCTVGGDADGHVYLAVNDAVGERLLGDDALITAAFAACIDFASIGLRASLFAASGVFQSNDEPEFVVEITDAGVVTSLVGVTLPLMRPSSADALDFTPATFEESEPEYTPVLNSLSVLDDVELLVTAELGRTTMAVRDLLGLTPGMVVEIDRAAGSPIDLLVNGRRIAAGEVVVIDEEFGIRITDIAPIGDRRR